MKTMSNVDGVRHLSCRCLLRPYICIWRFLFACMCVCVGNTVVRSPLSSAISTGSECLAVSLVNLHLLDGVSNFVQLSSTCWSRIVVATVVASLCVCAISHTHIHTHAHSEANKLKSACKLLAFFAAATANYSLLLSCPSVISLKSLIVRVCLPSFASSRLLLLLFLASFE